jgi:3-hydroxyisobutyrate dehydrogenase-like beta-hydroxyacid dehydrogenase
MDSITFIGFGEAAYHIAKGLRAASFPKLTAFDVMQDTVPTGERIHRRADEIGVMLAPNLDEAVAASKFVISLTSARVALDVAASVMDKLKPEQMYVDMNSASPNTKAEIDKLARAAGIPFCDAAVMGTIPGNGHTTPMFLTGNGAQAFCEAMTPYGMRLTVLDAPAGGASAIKMLKSVIMKGLPQLMFESFEAAEKYGVLDTLMDSLNSSLYGKSVEKLADTFIARTMLHAARRKVEMQDVLQMLIDLNVDSSMTRAVVDKLDRLEQEDWPVVLGEDGGKMGYHDAVALLVQRHSQNI